MQSDIITQIMGCKAMGEKSNLVFLVRFGVSVIELDQFHVSEYNQSYYIWPLQANSALATHASV